MTATVVLLFSKNHALAESRKAALEDAAYVVELAMTMDEFVDLFFEGEFDLIVLCNSLVDCHRDRAINLARLYAHTKPLIAISSTMMERIKGAKLTVAGDRCSLLTATSSLRLSTGPSGEGRRRSGDRSFDPIKKSVV